MCVYNTHTNPNHVRPNPILNLSSVYTLLLNLSLQPKVKNKAVRKREDQTKFPKNGMFTRTDIQPSNHSHTGRKIPVHQFRNCKPTYVACKLVSPSGPATCVTG